MDITRTLPLPLLAGLLAGWLGSSAVAQVDPSRLAEGASARLAPTLSNAQNLSAIGLDEENVFAPPSPGDEDIGQQLILKSAPKNRWFRAYADMFSYWTNNAANVSAGEEADWFWGGRIGAGYQPRLAKKLFADFDLQQQLYRYDQFDVLDFESLDATAGLIYIEPRLANALFFVQYDFNRITNDDFSEDLLNSHSIRAGAQKIFLFDRRNSLHLSVMGDWDVDTDLDELDRHEYIGDVIYRFKIMRDLVFALSYRYTFFDYQQADRSDSLHIAGASLTWSPWNWMDVYASANYSINESDVDAFDYETALTGGGVGVKIRF